MGKNAACASAATSLAEETSFSCDRSEEESQTEYLESIVKLLGTASKKLLAQRQHAKDCNTSTQAYNAKVTECTGYTDSLNNQTEKCNCNQTEVELKACIHWAWQEEDFGRCDESRHSFMREVSWVQAREQQNKAQVDKLWTMLCDLDTTYCGTKYNGTDRSFVTPTAPTCSTVTEEHPCTETWITKLNNEFPQV